MLASGSPRRRRLLDLAGIAHDVIVPDIDETPADGEDPIAEAIRLATAKARAVAAVRPGATVLGADTTLALDGRSLGTPPDRRTAADELRRLSGRRVVVSTGVAVVSPRAERAGATTATVELRTLGEDEIAAYVATGAADDTAGGLEIQDRAAPFVERIEGCLGAVIGLAVCDVADLLGRPAPCAERLPERCLAARYGQEGG